MNILAIDFGTERCKAVLFDPDGNVISSEAKRVSTTTFHGGTREIEESELLSCLFSCLRDTVPQNQRNRVGVVSITGQATTTVFLGSDGRVVRPIMSHLDTRADEHSKELRKRFPATYYTALKLGGNLSWLKAHEPRNFGRTKYVCDLKEYIGFLLTRQVTHDESSIRRKDVDAVTSFVGEDEAIFGEAHDYASPIGSLDSEAEKSSNVPKGVPVLVCPWDGMAGVVGSGLVRPNVVAEVAGTTEVIASPVPKDSPAATRDYFIPGLRLFYTSPPFGLVFEWFRQTCFGTGPGTDQQYSQMDREIASVNLREDSPIFIPSLASRWLNWEIRGTFHDIDLSEPRGAVGRAIMEGIAMAVHQTLDNAGLSVESTEIRLSGGGARSDVWNQIRADVTEHEITLLQTVETGCLGAGVFASVSLGEHSGIAKAADAMIHPGRRFRPNPERASTYKRLRARLERSQALESKKIERKTR